MKTRNAHKDEEQINDKKKQKNSILTPSAPRLRAVITAFDGARYMKKEMIVPATGTTLPRRTPGMVLGGGRERKRGERCRARRKLLFL